MTDIAENTTRTAPPQVSIVAHIARIIYVVLAGIFAIGIALQVFFAGAGVLVHPSYFAMHSTFGHLLEFFPFLMVVIGLIARLPWRMIGLSALLLFLFMSQYMFLYGVSGLTGLPVLRALHAVNALVLFWIAVHLTQRAWRVSQPLRRASAQRQPAVTA